MPRHVQLVILLVILDVKAGDLEVIRFVGAKKGAALTTVYFVAYVNKHVFMCIFLHF